MYICRNVHIQAKYSDFAVSISLMPKLRCIKIILCLRKRKAGFSGKICNFRERAA
jgi:hypothetical protein